MNVYVTPRAEKQFDVIIDYLKSTWGEHAAKSFVQKTDALIELLQRYPTMGQIEIENIRGFQLSRQIRLLYTVREDKLIILAFFDVRQSPDKKFR